jgi:hypothetical protein
MAFEDHTQFIPVMPEAPANATGGYQYTARILVAQYVIPRLDKTDKTRFSIDDVFVVWFSKVLQNWKALVSTTLPDGMYYEVTHNGDKNETYLDAYKKFDNVTIAG